jgi:hypothetical protein
MTPLEQRIAIMVGRKRDKTAKGADKHGLKKSDDGWKLHCSGVLGEMAVAKLLNLYWAAPIGNYKDADLGDKIQVKTRSHREYDLIYRRNDSVTEYFVLGLLWDRWIAPFEKKEKLEDWTVFVVGWKFGEYCIRDDWEQTYGKREKAWFVPQTELHTDFDRLLAHTYPDRRSPKELRRITHALGRFTNEGPLHPEAKIEAELYAEENEDE